MKPGDKSMAGKGILLVSVLVLMLSLIFVLAHQTDFTIHKYGQRLIQPK